MKKLLLSFLATIVFGLAMSGTANAQQKFGVRAGISANPEQVYFGVHADLAEVVKELWFRPNVEVGVGDDITVVALNADFIYHFSVNNSRQWRPYVGAGPAAVIGSRDIGNNDRDTDLGPGFNFIIGVEKQNGLMIEIKGGVLDSPGFKLGFGWNF